MQSEITNFQEIVWEYYARSGRHDLPWRQADMLTPYAIAVSEIMLQQTQVNRVLPKYTQFLKKFPTVQKLAGAELGDVLRVWQGLGYNRRAKYLWQAAQVVTTEHGGIFPREVSELVKLPGIGVNTAGAICAYAYDTPMVFIETNIRTVMIHHFFADSMDISDSMIREKVRETLPVHESSRQWYWALMDYGTYVKQAVGNLNKLSKTYTKQSAFHGSKRQLRGAILRMLSKDPQTEYVLHAEFPDERLDEVLAELLSEQLIHKTDALYSL